ncbi:XAP5 domain protein [Trichodelitschia bisporula]|uniref:XAP5 domain protein n=1 Tax=Trichodelitschia bisporula TaxID=703511 RepID=A0A6G1I031_9PEZI|nr:XAP5 domain protein [Trichodelitschia bisporula]
MDSSNPSSGAPSRSETPNPANRFTSQNATAEDLLRSQTVGLVQLSDFRKRRAEALEQKEREAHDLALGRLSTPGSGASTPRDGQPTSKPLRKKKKIAKGKVSFGYDDEEEESGTSAVATPRSKSPENDTASKKKLGPNSALGVIPKTMTKSALLREVQQREQLRKEFMAIQEVVKATEIAIPFVFYDGTNIPGGICRVKKGDFIWFFLDKARKVGAELGVGGDKGRREWARVSVDDLMFVRGEIILPHHLDFYYFIVNKVVGFSGLMFSYSSEPTTKPEVTKETPSDLSNYDPLSKPGKKAPVKQIPDEELEGFNDDPTVTKVVDRRWYERNKHIFPASVWEEFDPTKDYTKGIRKDAEGNTFFF